MSFLRFVFISALLLITLYIGLPALYHHLDPHTSQTEEASEDVVWIATSKSWLDRLACRWIGLCGLSHWHPDPANVSERRKWLMEGTVRFMGGREGRNNKLLVKNVREANVAQAEDISVNETIGMSEPSVFNGDSSILKEVPKYVLDHAPLVHLYSDEHFWPSDITEHLMHTTPFLNHTTFNLSNYQYTPYDLDNLNHGYDGNHVFLHSKDDVEERPGWLGSVYNKPIPYGDAVHYNESNDDDDNDENSKFIKSNNINIENELRKQVYSNDTFFNVTRKIDLRRSQILTPPSLTSSETQARPGGYSRASSILIIVDKGSGILDAFWFYFYSYNLGTTVFNIRFGNHVGDWEHSLIRFKNGVPQTIFFSAHSGGLAYDWNAVEKGKGEGREGRPILYSAVGTHAMYATPGRHSYILPFGLLADVTDKGPLWDPAHNYLAYHYNTSITHDVDARHVPNDTSSSTTIKSKSIHNLDDSTSSFHPAACNPSAPLGWWRYDGRWGDKFYELNDWRQWRFVGQYHYVNGPFGPRFKNLGRENVCQSGSECRIVKDLSENKSWIKRFSF
ncbi:Vacuolar protein sorting-associated protein 62 [Erysiphe neolycopersici]|uniref:Vacuolar protein sorting-associated protein 62 n=1 Tax=Erysiphe neolycopersici TaxID=212602 RepID=A0A420HNT3_9PEZI|nr:Vacuolar protein sorting-associated protein 62 [Erysiphe neolycopersici]